MRNETMTVSDVTPGVEDLLEDLEQQIVHWARANAGPRDWEDTAQEGRLAAANSLNTFKAERDVPAGAWAWVKAKYRMIDYLRTYGPNRRSHLCSIDDLPWLDEGAPAAGIQAVEDRALIREIASRATKGELAVLAGVAEGKTLTEVADDRGITISAVSRSMIRLRRRVVAEQTRRPTLRELRSAA